MTVTQNSNSLRPLRRAVDRFAALLDRTKSEQELLDVGGGILAELVSRDDWLPEEWAIADPTHHQQHLLHCDSSARFCIVSFVWAGGQAIPIHDHTVWGLVGVLRGSEASQAFRLDNGMPVPDGPEVMLSPGDVVQVSPSIGDLHSVRNALSDQTSISIHVYGGNIGEIERSVFTTEGQRKRFVSGYSNRAVPNIWNLTL